MPTEGLSHPPIFVNHVGKSAIRGQTKLVIDVEVEQGTKCGTNFNQGHEPPARLYIKILVKGGL